MKKILPLFAVAFFSMATHAQSTTQVAFSWTNSNSTLAACSTTVTSNCLSGYTLTDTTTNTVLGTPSGGTGIGTLSSTATSYTWTPSAGLYFGTHSFSLVANGLDGTGKALTSTAATTSVTNALTTLNPPTGFSGTAK